MQSLIIILILFTLFSGYYQIENESHRLYRVIDLGEYKALKDIGQNHTGEVAMADILTSLAVYPMTGNHVVAILSSNLGGGNAKAVYKFFSNDSSCKKKKRIFKKNNATLVISKEEINCDFLTEEKEGIFYLYSYNIGNIN